jgi:hypothetical protein
MVVTPNAPGHFSADKLLVDKSIGGQFFEVKIFTYICYDKSPNTKPLFLSGLSGEFLNVGLPTPSELRLLPSILDRSCYFGFFG